MPKPRSASAEAQRKPSRTRRACLSSMRLHERFTRGPLSLEGVGKAIWYRVPRKGHSDPRTMGLEINHAEGFSLCLMNLLFDILASRGRESLKDILISKGHLEKVAASAPRIARASGSSRPGELTGTSLQGRTSNELRCDKGNAWRFAGWR